ncbi:amino acid-binding protein [Pelagibius litoralis]|uniref:Amino acid-binding protein n=1 Tax=Pelagibius litoralis TaxID=374515 RepID=A0A967EXR4_9PROT|nr:glycine betaine ABC transporter substrate-binding protein [Pelagibius litoralis]NIA69340.1 amino acid-binding protein [Pelagibius litoralis]
MKINKALSSVGVAAILTMAGPAQAADVVIGVPNWPSVNATANILKVAIEENLGLSVELQNGTNPIVFEAMDKGSMHAHPEVWLPNQSNLHDTYVKEKGTVVKNENGVAAFQGMCVPKFVADEMGVKSITDLTDPDKAALFDTDGDGKGEVWIGAPGWASTSVEKVRARSYGYDETMVQTEMDETLAYANLDAAIKAKQPWVGFCYTPHYVFALHELHALEEPAYDAAKWNVLQPTDDPAWLEKSSAAMAWDTAYLHLHYAKSLESDFPEVAAIMANMKLTTEEVSAMTYALVIEKQEADAYAKAWVKDNEDRVLGWLSQ